MSDTVARLIDYLTGTFVPAADVVLDADTNLLEEEIVDSVGIHEMVEFIEVTFDVYIDADDVNLDNFETIASIAAMVDAKR